MSYNPYRGKPITKQRVKDSAKMAIPIGIYAIIYLTCFIYLENTNAVHYTTIHMAIDDKIPFLEIFVIPYLSWFFYVSGAVLLFIFLYEKEDYYKELSFMIAGMSIFLIVSALWPNIQYLRPTVMPRDNIFTHMVAYIYRTDTPTNVCPSIHVYNSIGAAIALCGSARVPKKGKIASVIMSSLIVLSVLFIKQHSMFDVLTATAMSAVAYVVIYRTDIVVNAIKKHNPEESEENIIA